jgi:hypothetical protein
MINSKIGKEKINSKFSYNITNAPDIETKRTTFGGIFTLKT